MKSKTISYKISEDRLKEIIAEELQRKTKLAGGSESKLTEDIDHEGAATVSKASSKLLKALASFKEDANGGMQSATTPHLDALVSTLEAMVQNPANYTDKVKVEPKRVKLRRVEESGGKLDCPRCGETNPRTSALNGECARCGEPLFPQKKNETTLRSKFDSKKLAESRYNWKPEAIEFMKDLLRTKEKTVPVGSAQTKIADTLQDVNMIRMKKHFKGPSGLVVVYELTDEGKEEFDKYKTSSMTSKKPQVEKASKL